MADRRRTLVVNIVANYRDAITGLNASARGFVQWGGKVKDASGNAERFGRALNQAGDQAKRAGDKLRVGLDKANLQLKQAEQAAGRAREAHARAAGRFGRDSDQAYAAALRVAGAQIRVRDATLKAADAQDAMSRSADRNVQVATRSHERWGKVSASLGKVAKTAALAGAALGAAAVVGAARFAKAGVQAAATFDLTMRQFAQVADLPKAQLEDMRTLALKMGKDTVYSAQQAGQAMLDLAKGGLSAAQIRGGALQATLTLAAAGGIELAQAGGTMANALNMFALSAKDSGRVAAALAGGANASTASVEDLTLALSQVGPGARNAGLSLQDTVGTLAAFHQAGIKGSDAGTSLKTMLSNLVPHTAKAASLMKKLGIDFTDAAGNIKPITEIADILRIRLGKLTQEQRSAALATLFGSDATRAATILMNEGAAGLGKYIKATQDQAAAEKLAATNTSGAAGAFESLKGSIETISIKIGTVLLPPLAAAAHWLADKLPSGLDQAGTSFGRLWDNIEPVRTALGRLWDTIKTSAGQIGTALSSAFKALSPSASDAQDQMRGLARFISVDLVGAVKGFTSFLVNDGIPRLLDFADFMVNKVWRPAGKAILGFIDVAGGALTGWVSMVVGLAGRLLHGWTLAWGWIPGVGAKLREADRNFGAFAKQTQDAMAGASRAMHTTREQGSKALDSLGRAVDGARGRYERFQKEAKTPITVKVTANINELIRRFGDGHLKARDFRVKANAEIAKITAKPARDKLQKLVDDLSHGKISVAQFRSKWNVEMARLHGKDLRVTAKATFGWSSKTFAVAGTRVRMQAAGGPIDGPGTETSDSIPAMLSRGEHVISAREVKGAGGHKALERMRATWRTGDQDRMAQFAHGGFLRGYAAGGAIRWGSVSPRTWQALLAAGWRGHAGDRMEALYPPSGYRWSGRRAPLLPGRIGGNAFRVNHFLRRMDDARRETYAELYGVPKAPRGWAWAEDFTLVPNRFYRRAKGGPIGRYANGGVVTRLTGLDKVHTDAQRWRDTAITGARTLAQISADKTGANTANQIREVLADAIGGIGGVGGVRIPGSRNRNIVHQVFRSMFGWGSSAQMAATDQLLMHESGYRNTAQNPTSTAYGLFQFLNGTWGSVGGHKTSDPQLQAIYGGRYIRSRYGSPVGAWSFWRGHHWYDQGGMLMPGTTLATNRTGRPEPVGFDYDKLAAAIVKATNRSGGTDRRPVQLVVNGRVLAEAVTYEQHRLAR